jgi:hypothetical protein
MRSSRIRNAVLAWIVAAAVIATAEAGGPAGGIGFSKSWGTTFVPPTIGRSAAPAAPSLKTFPAPPPTAWFQTFPPVQRGPNLRPLERRPPVVRPVASGSEARGGCFRW